MPKIKEVVMRGNMIITVPHNGSKIPYVTVGLSKKDSMNRFFGFINRLERKGFTTWYIKPRVYFDENASVSETEIPITGGWVLTSTIYTNPILHTLEGNLVDIAKLKHRGKGKNVTNKGNNHNRK